MVKSSYFIVPMVYINSCYCFITSSEANVFQRCGFFIDKKVLAIIFNIQGDSGFRAQTEMGGRSHHFNQKSSYIHQFDLVQ